MRIGDVAISPIKKRPVLRLSEKQGVHFLLRIQNDKSCSIIICLMYDDLCSH